MVCEHALEAPQHQGLVGAGRGALELSFSCLRTCERKSYSHVWVGLYLDERIMNDLR